MDEYELVLDLISKGKSLNQILAEINYDSKKLKTILSFIRNNGNNISRKYYYSGDIVYSQSKEKSEEISIITSSHDQVFKAILISDLHLGSINDRLDLLYLVYDYAVKKGINIIINAGDFLNGLMGSDGNKYNTYQKQLKYALDNHPYDKSIVNFVCLGNHDYSFIYDGNIDVKDKINEKRLDIIPISYGISKINIKNEQITVRHPLDKKSNTINSRLIINGHTHKGRIISGKGTANIFVPSLSDIKIYGDTLPGFIEMNLSFHNGYFNYGVFDYYVIENKLFMANRYEMDLSLEKNNKECHIKNEENYQFTKKINY